MHYSHEAISPISPKCGNTTRGNQRVFLCEIASLQGGAACAHVHVCTNSHAPNSHTSKLARAKLARTKLARTKLARAKLARPDSHAPNSHDAKLARSKLETGEHAVNPQKVRACFPLCVNGAPSGRDVPAPLPPPQDLDGRGRGSPGRPIEPKMAPREPQRAQDGLQDRSR